tara:strand:- start:357 stop:1187 length:831 start_codon:yes stop_codon:yes gene_type:complete
MKIFFNTSEKVILKFILLIFTVLLTIWTYLHYTEKNIYYSHKLFIAVDVEQKYHSLDNFISDKFSKNKNSIIQDITIYTREGYNLEFQTWNYKNSVVDIIQFRPDYKDKFIFEEDEKFFQKTYNVHQKNRKILKIALANPLIRSEMGANPDLYQSAVVYIGYKNKNLEKIILDEIDKIFLERLEISIKDCQKKTDKIEYLNKAYLVYLKNNYNASNSSFVKDFEYSDLKDYNCKNFFYTKDKKVIVQRYNTYVFVMILFLLFSLIIIPTIYRIKKE